MIGNKWWDKSAGVGIDRISSASSGRAARFEQPRPLAELNTDNARLLRRAQCVRRFPAVRIDKSSDAWPGGFVGAQREIPISTNLGRNSLVAQERVAFAPKEPTLCHIRHETRISIDILDDRANRAAGRSDFAHSFEFFQERPRMGSGVNRDPVALGR